MGRAQQQRLFGRLASILNEATKLVLTYGAPQNAKRVLVLSPHPDDESVGCGGTLAQLADGGSEIDVVFLTPGSPAGVRSIADVRQREAYDAGAILGIKDLIFLGGQDGKLYSQFALADKLRDMVQQNRYDTIFCPWPYEDHPDHAAAFRMLSRAAKAIPAGV